MPCTCNLPDLHSSLHDALPIFLDYADTEHITVMRYEPIEIPGRPWARTFKRVPFNYKRVIAAGGQTEDFALQPGDVDRKSTRLNSSHSQISYAVFCLTKKQKTT